MRNFCSCGSGSRVLLQHSYIPTNIPCRHRTFAEYFGEEPPRCGDRCDACADERAVRRALEQHQRRAMSARIGSAAYEHHDPADLYGEGRYGQKREMQSYYADDSGESDGESSRRQVAEETKSLIMQEFANRKKNLEHDRKKNDESESAKYSKCRAAESTSKKVNGLTISGREGYLTLLCDALNNNLSSMKEVDKPDKPLTRSDVEQCAADLEYEAFTGSTVISLYRRAMTKLISAIKHSKDQLYPRLKAYEPKKPNTLSEFVKDYEAQKHKNQGFITAAQLEMENHGKASDSQALSKSDKHAKRKANSFKRDPLQQTKLQSFFKKASNCSPPCSTPDASEDDENLVIDEFAVNNHDDTTLKLDEPGILDKQNDTTLKLNETSDDDDDDNKGTDKNTLVINITLKGIPSDKGKKEEKQENTCSDSHKKERKKISESIESPLKTNTAKRKIKALFGESSDSDDVDDTSKKKVKYVEQKKKKHSRENNKNKHKDHVKKEKTKNYHQLEIDKKTPKSEVLFSKPSSDSESEKELVIDDGTESQSIEVKVSSPKLNESHNSKVTVSSDWKKQLAKTNKALEEYKKNLNKQSTTPLKHDVEKQSDIDAIPSNKFGSPIDTNNSSLVDMNVDDVELNKAHKLSKEADAVLLSLKKFSEQPQEPLAVEIPKKDKLPSPITSQSPKIREIKCKVENKCTVSKHNRSVLSLNKSKDKLHLEKLKEKHKAEKIKKKEDKKAKKTEKVDVASLVVKLLMPYYKNKKISSRDLFKITARHIVHQLLAIQVTEETAIDLLLQKAFSKQIKIENESDLVVKLNLNNNM